MEPAFYDTFKCIGAACEDTCCEGWSVPVDRLTYIKYQTCSDELGPKLRNGVTIQNSESELRYAEIQLSDGRCPFLSEGLCGIQTRLGEEYLGRTCVSYPRVFNGAERSLDMACPEAARLALLNKEPIQFTGGTVTGVRRFVLGLLQNRKYPVSKRLLMVGVVCDQWSAMACAGISEEEKAEFLSSFGQALDEGLYEAEIYADCVTDPGNQIKIVLDLMVARLGLAYTPPRYLNLYREFVDGLRLKMPGSLPEIGQRYAEAYRCYYAPFMRRHDHIMENYLVAYAFKTMFPFGSPSVNRLLALPASYGVYVAQYMLMASYYSITQAVMIGLAGKYKNSFNVEHVVTAVQSIARTFEHCETYPRKLLEVLASRGIRSAGAMQVLTQIASETDGKGKSVATSEGAIIMPPSRPRTRMA